jgi:antitoxin component YwqK of YwqJK toxin-antitoxin module
LLISCSCQKIPQEEELVLLQIQDRNGLSETISDQEKLSSYTKTDFLSTQPYKKVLRLYREEGKNRSVITTYHPNGTIWQLLEAKEMRAFGAYREWFSNGTKKIKATVIGGNADLTPEAQETWLFEGISKVWNEKGTLVATVPYEKGQLTGASISYYPSGAIDREIPYAQDRIDGEEKAFWENGQLKSKTMFREGTRNGVSLGFWADGTLSWEEDYEQDRLIRGTYWSLDHELISEVKNGSGFKAIFDQTHLCMLEEIRKGAPEGVVKCFVSSNQLHSIYHFKNGKKQGEEIEYFPPQEDAKRPLPKISLYWDQDTIHGTVKTWYENGQLQSQREVYKNKKAGTSCAWYRNGSLMLLEDYENNQLERGQYYRKGQPSPVSAISGGNGVVTLYDGDGFFLDKVTYLKGKPIDPG